MLNRLENVNKQNIPSWTVLALGPSAGICPKFTNQSMNCGLAQYKKIQSNDIEYIPIKYLHTIILLPNHMSTVYEMINQSESI